MKNDEVLTIEEAAVLLQIHADTIELWIERGLPTTTIGEGEVGIRRSDLDEFLRRENQGASVDVAHEV